MSSETVRHNLVPPHLSSILPSTPSARILTSHPLFPSSLLPHCFPWNGDLHPLGYKPHFLQEAARTRWPPPWAESCPILSDPTDCSPPGSSVHGIFQARVLEWGAIAFSDPAYKWHLKNISYANMCLIIITLNLRKTEARNNIHRGSHEGCTTHLFNQYFSDLAIQILFNL